MGLKCSLLGHSFDDAEVERDREERGDEVVTIVREVEHCVRCDETRVVSENKEVTTVVEPETVGVDDADDADDAATTGHDDGATAGPSDDHDEYDPPDDPTEEDAEILGEDDEPDRDPGEWPETGADDDAVETDTLTAEEPNEADPAGGSDDAEPAESELRDAEPEEPTEDDPTASGNVTVPDDRYRCPECGFRTEAAGSSLRAGDACPDCQRGYLETENGERNS